MSIELRVPEVGESVSEVEIGPWLKAPGDVVVKDEPLVTLESEKATIELPCPAAGVLSQQLKHPGDVVKVGEIIGYVDPSAESGARPSGAGAEPPKAATAPAPSPPQPTEPRVMPAAQRALEERGMKAADVTPSGPGGRLLKEDVLRASEPPPTPSAPPPPASDSQLASAPELKSLVSTVPGLEPHGAYRQEEVVPMSRLRRTIAQRLVEAQHNAALLTTFNEIDMSGVMTLRKTYGEAFLQKYSVKLGFMSFFVKGVVDALKQFPAVNAEIRGSSTVFRNYYDIGVAVGSGKG